jgi:hypothetical protein
MITKNMSEIPCPMIILHYDASWVVASQLPANRKKKILFSLDWHDMEDQVGFFLVFGIKQLQGRVS